MKFEVQSQLFIESIKKNQTVSDKPHYMHFKADIAKSTVTIYSRGKDYNKYIFTTTPATIYEIGECVIDGDKMANLVKTMSGSIGISVINEKNKERLQLMYRGKKYKFDILDPNQVSVVFPSDFPKLFKQSNDVKFDLFCTELNRLSSFAITGDKFHQFKEFAQTRLIPKENKIIFDVCESVIFSRNSYTVNDLKYEQNFLIHISTIPTLSRLFGKSVSQEKVTLGDNWVCISNHNTFYFQRLSSIKYPDVDNIWINRIPKFNIKCNLIALRETINRCVILTEDSKGFTDTAVEFDVAGGVLKISIPNKLEEEIEIENTSSGSFIQTYSSEQVLDALKNIYRSEYVSLGYIEDKNPLLISDNEGYMVMCQYRKPR